MSGSLWLRNLADLLGRGEHKRGRQQDASFNMPYPGGLQGLLEVIGDPHFYDFSFECERPHHRLGRGKLRSVKAVDAKDCYAREPGNDLLEQPHFRQSSVTLREDGEYDLSVDFPLHPSLRNRRLYCMNDFKIAEACLRAGDAEINIPQAFNPSRKVIALTSPGRKRRPQNTTAKAA
jgi:hypothetical protein